MKKILQWIWLIPIFLLTSTGILAEETIRITIGEWAPYLSKDLKHYGVAARIVTDSFALEGVKVEYGFFPWARSKFLAQEGEWDGSAVWIHNAERAKDFLFSDSMFKSPFDKQAIGRVESGQLNDSNISNVLNSVSNCLYPMLVMNS